MIAILSFFKLIPGWLYALVAVIALVGAGMSYEHERGKSEGKAIVQAKFDAYIAERAKVDAAADHENRVIESRYQSNVTEAQNAATLRAQSLQAAAVAARAQSDSLRNDLAKLRREMPNLTPEAINQRADALAVVLDQCQQEYRDMAANADRHASDTKTLSDAWPK